MSHEKWELGLTFVFACISAWGCLLARCHGTGRAFSRHGRRWALGAIATTGAVSTVAALALLGVWHVLPAYLVAWLVGIAGPSGLYLERIRGENKAHSGLRSIATFGLDWLLGQLEAAMADDKDEWCRLRIDPQWDAEHLFKATITYHDYLESRLSDEDCTNYRIDAIRQEIEARLVVVRIIDTPADDLRRQRTKIRAELKRARLSRQNRYEQYLDNLTLLSQCLLHDARRDLERMLGVAYYAKLDGLEVYLPRQEAVLEPAGIIATPRPHP
jgi:hypothetical protein